MDLKFPHHENEIAQSEGATGEKFVNTWMHVGFVRVNQEKMSKSLGNFFTVREVLKAYDPEVLRYFILASHYRSPLDYSDDNLQQAKAALTRLYLALKELPPEAGPLAAGETLEEWVRAAMKDGLIDDEAAFAVGYWKERFFAAMDDDFNTPGALAVLFDLARDINKLREQGGVVGRIRALAAMLRRLGGMLGLLKRDAQQYLQGGVADGLTEAQIEEQLARRSEARRNKQWAESDRIRDELKAKGVLLEDVVGGKTVWRRQ